MIRLCDSQVAARYCVGVRCTSCLPPASRLQHDGTEHMGTFFPIIGGERFVVFVFFACMGTAGHGVECPWSLGGACSSLFVLV